MKRIAASWPALLLRIAWRRFGEDNSFALAGYLAYTGLLSFFPFMIFLVVTGSFVVGRETSLALVDHLFAFTPVEVSSTLAPILRTIIASKTGLLALVSAAVGLWAGSNAFEAARVGFNLAYDVKEDRHFVRRRLQSLALAGAAAGVFVCLAILIVLWPTIARMVAAAGPTSLGFDLFYLARYAIGVPMLCLLLIALHLNLPKGHRDGFRLHVFTERGEAWAISVVPGVLASAALWFVGATLFSLYLAYAPSFAGNYGAMAGVVITLLFFYMSAVTIFFGAQINIAREEIRRAATQGATFAEAAEPGSLTRGERPIGAAPDTREIARLREALKWQG